MSELSRYKFAREAEELVKADERERPKRRRIKYIAIIAAIYIFFPQYWKPLIYPFLYGKESGIEQDISAGDSFEDAEYEPFEFERKGTIYKLLPKTKYTGGGRVGIVEHYDGLFNRIYRNWSQKSYIDLVPRDVFIVVGKMADPDIFKLFAFDHEERVGYIMCKGVKYRTSFMASFSSMEQWRKSQENLEKCSPYYTDKEYNNYHPIPANETINAALSMLKHGDVISLEGYLVDVELNGRTYLETATRHSQSHPWALIGGMQSGWCFIIYVTKVVINGVLYE